MAVSSARRWWALGALCLAVLVVGLDGTVLSVVLPTLALKLHASESDLQWFSSAYLLVLAACMLPAGVLGDRYGRRRVLLVAIALFGLGSAACAVARSSAAFIAARVALGGAGAGIIVMALSALTVLFSEAERPRAVGVWSAANFLALPVGPILGGWLLSHVWWGWIFLMNLPVVALALVAVARLLPESRPTRAPALDRVGVVTSTAGLTGLTFGLIEASRHGWSSPVAVGAILGGLLALLGFAAWERRLAARIDGEPLVDPGLFRSRSYTWGVILIAVAVMAMMGVLFTMPQYFQGVRGLDALGSGVRLLALIGGLTAGALPADRIGRRVGAKLTTATGFLLLTAGLAVGSTVDLGSGTEFTAGWMALVGAGMGLALATASSAALAELRAEQAAIGSAVLQAANKTGGPLGTAVLGSVLSTAYLSRLADALHGLPAPAARAARSSIFGAVAMARRLHDSALLHAARGAFVHGLGRSLVIAAISAGAGALLALLFLPTDDPTATAPRTVDGSSPLGV